MCRRLIFCAVQSCSAPKVVDEPSRLDARLRGLLTPARRRAASRPRSMPCARERFRPSGVLAGRFVHAFGKSAQKMSLRPSGKSRSIPSQFLTKLGDFHSGGISLPRD